MKAYLLMCECWGGQHYYDEVISAYKTMEKAEQEADKLQSRIPAWEARYFVLEVEYGDEE